MKSERVKLAKLAVTRAPSQALVDSIRKIDVVMPVILRRSDLRVVDGEQRVAACKILNFDEVPAVLVDVTDEQIEESRMMRSSGMVTASAADYKANLARLCKMSPDTTLRELAERLGLE